MHRSALDLLLIQIPNLRETAYLIGVASLKAFLSESGYQVECFNPAAGLLRNANPHKKNELETLLSNSSEFHPPALAELSELIHEIRTRIKQTNPRHIGFSVIFGNLSTSLMVAKEIKKSFPNIPMLLGGPGVKLDVSEDAKREVADFIFYGDSEYTLREFFEGKTKEEILDLGWHSPQGWRRNPARVNSKDILPFPQPDYSDFQNDSHASSLLSSTPITLGRGCPFRCKFCSVKSYGLEYRHFRIEACIDFLKQQVDLGKNHFFVHDPITNGNPGWIREFSRQILKNNLQISWGGNIRLAKYLLETETLDLLFESGFRTMITGLESGSPNVLQHMRKYAEIENIYKIFDKIRGLKSKYEINILLQLIVGYPTETESDFQMTLNLVRDHRDIIGQVFSCSAFLIIPSENDEMADLIKDPQLHLKYISDSNWSTIHSNPEIRLSRMQRAARLFEELKIPHRLFYLDRLLEITPQEHLDLIPTARVKNASPSLNAVN
jgi:radical SAM superfamily enzyme YgiQ (UPF0313 family)